MVSSSRLFAAVAASMLLAAGSAHAYCGYIWYPGTISYSYAAPIYSYPIYPSPVFSPFRSCPIESPIYVTPLAEPQPAPPSTAPTNREPPLGNLQRKGPTITESRSQAGAYAGVGMVLPRCKVGFWNLTGKDITVRIDGKDQSLPKDRSVTLELDRQFSWQAPGREATMERVPEDQNVHEVVIRPNID